MCAGIMSNEQSIFSFKVGDRCEITILEEKAPVRLIADLTLNPRIASVIIFKNAFPSSMFIVTRDFFDNGNLHKVRVLNVFEHSYNTN